MNAIEVVDVAKTFFIPVTRRDTIREHALAAFWPQKKRALQVLRSMSFEIGKGERVAIMGRNGSGKSTLLKLLCGIYQPDRGRVRIHGGMTPILELGLGWNGELTARDNLTLTATAMGMSLRQVHYHLDEMIEFAGLREFVDLQLKFFSTGMSARLAYSVAFHVVKDILLLDEILAVGDAAFKARCRERYQRLAERGHTIVLVSHDRGEVANFCHRALLIEDGRVALDGTPDEVGLLYEDRLKERPGGVG